MSEFSDWSGNERYGACGDAERTNREENASESSKATLQEHEHGARQSKLERDDKNYLNNKLVAITRNTIGGDTQDSRSHIKTEYALPN